jgi:hypothetical protein|tara:strand:+ start:146 stop:457 length:312 start_codon:yes stop_codon:yes gene_type:complete
MLAIAVAAVGFVNHAHAQLDDSANLRILSARSQAMTINADYFNNVIAQAGISPSKEDLADELRGKTDCGSISIGNQYTDTSFANEVTIIIVGDITNVGNSCSY